MATLANTTALELLRIVASEYAGETDDKLSMYIELAGQTVSATVFEPVYKQAVVYLAAHLLSMDDRANSSGGGGGAAGPVIGERAGEVSLNYGFSASGAGSGVGPDGLDSTVYGRRFLALRRAMSGNKPFSTGQSF